MLTQLQYCGFSSLAYAGYYRSPHKINTPSLLQGLGRSVLHFSQLPIVTKHISFKPRPQALWKQGTAHVASRPVPDYSHQGVLGKPLVWFCLGGGVLSSQLQNMKQKARMKRTPNLRMYFNSCLYGRSRTVFYIVCYINANLMNTSPQTVLSELKRSHERPLWKWTALWEVTSETSPQRRAEVPLLRSGGCSPWPLPGWM